MLKGIGMFDIWRELHPSVKQYTFFSHPHAVYSRIYSFFMSTERHRIVECNIGVSDVSDHSGVYLSLNLDAQPRNTLWMLNTTLLNDHQCEEFIKKEIKKMKNK